MKSEMDVKKKASAYHPLQTPGVGLTNNTNVLPCEVGIDKAVYVIVRDNMVHGLDMLR